MSSERDRVQCRGQGVGVHEEMFGAKLWSLIGIWPITWRLI